MIEEDLRINCSNRVPCLGHNVSLLLRKVLDPELKKQGVLKKCKKICRKYRKSGSATHVLLIRTRRELGKSKTVLLPSIIRWGTAYIMINRMCELVGIVNTVGFYLIEL